MTQNSIDPLEVDSLPTDPRVMALRLLGMTAAEMKDIDKTIISGSNSLGGLKLDINKMVQEFNTSLAPEPQTISITPTVLQQATPTIENTALPTTQPSNPVLTVQPIDTGQMEFDFYKKITPEDIDNRFSSINKSLKSIEQKTELILELIKQKKNE